MFMENKAVFTICDSASYAELRALNAEKAARLHLLPIKTPYDGAPRTGYETEFVNAALPMEVSWYFCLNARADADLRAAGVDFLLWAQNWLEGTENALEQSLRARFKAGNVLSLSGETPPAAWTARAFGEGGIRNWLRKENWTEEDAAAITDFLVNAWAEVRAAPPAAPDAVSRERRGGGWSGRPPG
jgi:hypothetical protein